MSKTFRITLIISLIFISIVLERDFIFSNTNSAGSESDQTSGWFWQVMEQIDKMCKIDMLPYWMPLNQGNTKTLKYTVPDIEDTFAYTISIQGTEIVKGVEVVKEVVTESSYQVGDIIEGSYKAYVKDLSEGKIWVKDYYGTKPLAYYELYVPFRKIGRYISPIPGKVNSSTYAIGSYDGDNKLVDSGVQVITTKFLGFEDVTVPAGTFKDCLKTSFRFTNSFQNDYKGRTRAISVEDIWWEAKGLGIVKIKTNEISYMNQTDDDSIINTVFEGGISELSSATVDGVDYP